MQQLPAQMRRVKEIVCSAAEDDYDHRIRGMADVDANKRLSAGDLINATFNGQGRTTERAAAPTTQATKAPSLRRSNPRTKYNRYSRESRAKEIGFYYRSFS